MHTSPDPTYAKPSAPTSCGKSDAPSEQAGAAAQPTPPPQAERCSADSAHPGSHSAITAAAAASSASAAPSPSGEPASELANEPDLLAELAQLKAHNLQLADQYLRAKAEADNARRRADDEIAKARKFAVEALAESLLPVLDSLEAGLALPDATAQQLRSGTEATLAQLQASLARHKVLPIAPAAGARFDPHQHQAISLVPAAQEAQTVVAVLQKGYTIAERVLRPAMVSVAAPQ